MIHAVHVNMLVLLLVTVGTLELKWNTVCTSYNTSEKRAHLTHRA